MVPFSCHVDLVLVVELVFADSSLKKEWTNEYCPPIGVENLEAKDY